MQQSVTLLVAVRSRQHVADNSKWTFKSTQFYLKQKQTRTGRPAARPHHHHHHHPVTQTSLWRQPDRHNTNEPGVLCPSAGTFVN